MISYFQSYIETTTKAALDQVILDKQDFSAIVNLFFTNHSKYTRITEVTFDSHSEFYAALDKAIRNLLNQPSINGPEILAKYIDVYFRKKDVDQDLNGMVTNSLL